MLYRPTCVVRAPVSTRSGYGGMSRDIVRHLIEYDKYDTFFIVEPSILLNIYIPSTQLVSVGDKNSLEILVSYPSNPSKEYSICIPFIEKSVLFTVAINL